VQITAESNPPMLATFDRKASARPGAQGERTLFLNHQYSPSRFSPVPFAFKLEYFF
jgi:hypothetical protein